MPARTPAVEYILDVAKKQAIEVHDESIESIHFLWATYHTESHIEPQAIEWMEGRGVNTLKVKQMTTDAIQSKDNNEVHCLPSNPKIGFSEEFKKILNIARAMHEKHLLTTESIICSILMYGKSQTTDILEACSNGRVQPFKLSLPGAPNEEENNVLTQQEAPQMQPATSYIVKQTNGKEIVGPLDPKVLPRYGGFATFARLPRIEEVSNFNVAIMGMPYDSGCTFRPGARFGPSAVREASRILRGYHPVLDVNAFLDQQVVDAGDVCCNPFHVEESMQAVANSATDIIQRGGKLMSIGGDHSISYPLLKAHYDRYGPLALLHFDAHLDTWDTYFGQTHTHGTPFRRAAEEGLFCDQTSMHIGIRGPVYDAKDFVDDAELGFKIIRADDIEDIGIRGVINRIKNRVGNTPLYISIDIDVLDPAFASGTGTPEAGGFTSRELLNILRGLKDLDVVGADVVEVAPAYDHAQITCMAASTLCFELMSLMAVNKC